MNHAPHGKRPPNKPSYGNRLLQLLVLVLLSAGLLAACNTVEAPSGNNPIENPDNGQPNEEVPGDDNGQQDEETQEPDDENGQQDEETQEPNSIALAITGLPSDVTPSITVTGPNGFMEVLREDELLTELDPGEYTVHSSPREIMGTTFSTKTNRTILELEPDGTLEHTVSYAPHRELSQASLKTLNELRAAHNLEPVTLDSENTLGNWLHARYVAENGVGGHTQDPDMPWYTPEGASAAARSNVSWISRKSIHSDWPVTTYIDAPFHLFSLLRPTAESIRVGEYYSEAHDRSASTLQVTTRGDWPAGKIVTFPSPEFELTVLTYSGGEWPSPTAPCPNYGTNERAGTPIFALYGRNNRPNITRVRLTENGRQVEHCYYTEAEYTNADAEAEDRGRNILEGYGGVIIVPKTSLAPNSNYKVSIHHSDGKTEWNFNTGKHQSQYYSGGPAIRELPPQHELP